VAILNRYSFASLGMTNKKGIKGAIQQIDKDKNNGD